MLICGKHFAAGMDCTRACRALTPGRDEVVFSHSSWCRARHSEYIEAFFSAVKASAIR